MSDDTQSGGGKLPGTFKAFVRRFPELGEAHQRVGDVVQRMGPLDPKQTALIKMGICIGAGLESAFRSHARRAIQHGATEAELEQAIMLAMNTVGFPKTVMAWSWLQVQLERDRADADARSTAQENDR